MAPAEATPGSQRSMTGLPRRLIYSSHISSSFPALPEDQDDAIGAIVRASIRNNRQTAVTGLLLAHQGWFLQALEGPAKAVEETYARILDDPRHRNSTVLSDGMGRREFPNWNMCARRLSRADDAILAGLSAGPFDPPTWTGGQALGVLLDVRDRQEATMTALT
jgi:hypothetical protein